MFDVDRDAITDGPVGRVLLLLAAPLVAQNLVYVANALVDTFWLGRVSEDAVAAPVLIFGLGPIPPLGVAGAALGTAIAGVVGLVHVLAYAVGIHRDSFRLTRESFAVDASMLREIVTVGLPLGGQRGISELVRVLVVGLVAIAGGAAGVAAYTVGARVATLAIVPALGTQQAAQSMIGQNLAASYWALGGTYTLLAGFNGASRTQTAFVADLIKYWGIRFPIGVAAVPATATFGAFGVAGTPGLDWGVDAVFWAVAVSNVVGFLGLAAYFAYTTRRGMFANAAKRATDDGITDDAGSDDGASPSDD